MAYILNQALLDKILEGCLKAYDDGNTNPLDLIESLWDIPDFPMHCPEHHILIPAVLLTVYRTLRCDPRSLLEDDLKTADERGRHVLPGFCGYYGACGAGIGGGLFLSILTDTTPLSVKTWGLANKLSAKCLDAIAGPGGPRCCKRVSYLAIEHTLPFIKDRLGLELELVKEIKCRHHDSNRECLRDLCPYYQEDLNG